MTLTKKPPSKAGRKEGIVDSNFKKNVEHYVLALAGITPKEWRQVSLLVNNHFKRKSLEHERQLTLPAKINMDASDMPH